MKPKSFPCVCLVKNHKQGSSWVHFYIKMFKFFFYTINRVH